MSMSIYREEEELERLRIQDEKAEKQLSIAQKRAAIKELKKRHGINWKAFADKMSNGDWFRVSAELRNSVIPTGRRA